MRSRLLPLYLLLTSAALIPLGFAAPPPSPKEPTPEYIDAVRAAVQSFGNRDFPKTLESLDKAEELLGPSPITLNTRGAVFIEQKRFAEGAALCHKALELDPKFYPARFNLCEIPMMQKRYADARAMFQKILDEFPRDELVMYRVMLTYLMEKNDTEARRMLEHVPFPGKTAAYYYSNAAWEFSRGNEEEGHKWIKRGNWVFGPQMTVNFSDALKEVGWISATPPVSDTLPEFANKPDGASPSKLAPARTGPDAPLVPDKPAPAVPKPDATPGN